MPSRLSWTMMTAAGVLGGGLVAVLLVKLAEASPLLKGRPLDTLLEIGPVFILVTCIRPHRL